VAFEPNALGDLGRRQARLLADLGEAEPTVSRCPAMAFGRNRSLV